MILYLFIIFKIYKTYELKVCLFKIPGIRISVRSSVFLFIKTNKEVIINFLMSCKNLILDHHKFRSDSISSFCTALRAATYQDAR